MAIDELVYQIQQGRDDLIPELWNAVKGLIRYFAIRFSRQWDCSRYGIELDDLVQEGYFAMLETLRKHDPEKGSFNTLFAYDLRKAFQNAIGRTDRKRGDLLNYCLSLDAEIDSSEPNSDSMYERIPDGYDYAGAVEQKIYIQQLHDELEKALAAIPADQAEVLRSIYFDGRTLTEIAAERSQTCENIRRKKENGLRTLRSHKCKKELEKFIDQRTDFYSGSSAEKIAIHRENVAQYFRHHNY